MLLERWLHIWNTMKDEWRHIFVQRPLLLVLFGLPLIYPLIISGLYMHKQVVERPAIVVDNDNSALSRELTLGLDATQGITVIDRMADASLAWERVKRQDAEVLLFIPDNFSSEIKKGRYGKLKLWINSADVLTYGTSYPAVTDITGYLNEKLGEKYMLDLGHDSGSADRRVMPIEMNTKYLYHPSVNYGDFVVVPILLIVLQQIVLIAMSFSLGVRRENGPVYLHPKFPFSTIEARALAQVLFYVIGAVFMIFVVMPVFDWPTQNPYSMLFIFIAFIFSIAPMAMIIAMLMKDRYEAFQLLMLFSTPIFLMSGYTWPIERMSPWVQAVANSLPATPALQALFHISNKSGNLLEVLPCFRHMAVLFVIYLLLAIIIMQLIAWNRRRVARRTTA